MKTFVHDFWPCLLLARSEKSTVASLFLNISIRSCEMYSMQSYRNPKESVSRVSRQFKPACQSIPLVVYCSTNGADKTSKYGANISFLENF